MSLFFLVCSLPILQFEFLKFQVRSGDTTKISANTEPSNQQNADTKCQKDVEKPTTKSIGTSFPEINNKTSNEPVDSTTKETSSTWTVSKNSKNSSIEILISDDEEEPNSNSGQILNSKDESEKSKSMQVDKKCLDSDDELPLKLLKKKKKSNSKASLITESAVNDDGEDVVSKVPKICSTEPETKSDLDIKSSSRHKVDQSPSCKDESGSNAPKGSDQIKSDTPSSNQGVSDRPPGALSPVISSSVDLSHEDQLVDHKPPPPLRWPESFPDPDDQPAAASTPEPIGVSHHHAFDFPTSPIQCQEATPPRPYNNQIPVVNSRPSKIYFED